ncbi:MAG: DUF3800 domain-containing protein [Acidobacteriia bacterium]|nr:DUF3800 domain-containing protein [Terriglobia bacterium]
MPFTVYFDDSGSDPQQLVANATGLIIPAQRIIPMEREWESLKKKEGFSDFHTSEFVARNRDSEFATWDDKKHKRVFRRIRQITRKYGAQVFSFSVKKDDYDYCVPTELRKYMGEHHYSWAIRQASMFAQLWKRDKKVSEPYEWIFDWMEKHEPGRKEIERTFEQMEYLHHRLYGIKNEYAHADFRSGKTLAGLRCADLLAWTNFNFSLHQWNLLGRPLHPFAVKAWDDFESMPSSRSPSVARLFHSGNDPVEWNCAVVLTRNQLEGLVQSELQDGHRVSLIKEWEEHKKAGTSQGV